MVIRITQKHDLIGNSKVVTPVVHYKGRSVLCDGNLPRSLSLLVPNGWGNAKLEDWQPFVYRAIVLGIL